jgi:pyruvate formate lyase activating enzyme
MGRHGGRPSLFHWKRHGETQHPWQIANEEKNSVFTAMTLPQSDHPGRWWAMLPDGRIECRLCPRFCKLNDGQRGFCFVRMRAGDRMILTTYGRSSGFCVDPIEKKPLNHFLPGTSVLSFGTAGCNLGCRFCQNWDISKAREWDRLADAASPEEIARTAKHLGCRSVAFTYNDPVIFAEYAIDAADACRELGIKTVAVTAGYITADARPEFYRHMDGANVDLKAFTDQFYHRLCYAQLQPVLETLVYLRRETSVWFEVTTLLIPGENDSDPELHRAAEWFAENLGPDVPWHFTAFHPDFKMLDSRARRIARSRAPDGSHSRRVWTMFTQVTSTTLRAVARGARAVANALSSAIGTCSANGISRATVAPFAAMRSRAGSRTSRVDGAHGACQWHCWAARKGIAGSVKLR